MNPHLDFSKALSWIEYGPKLRPRRDWFVLLSIALILLLSSFAINAYLFMKVANGGSLSGAVVASPQPASSGSSSLDAAGSVFAARAKSAAVYAQDPGFKDPSK